MCVVVIRQLNNSLFCESGIVFELRLADIVQIWATQRIRSIVQDGAKFVDGCVDVQKEAGDEVRHLLHGQLPTKFLAVLQLYNGLGRCVA
jgi:hypothetical protein